MRLRRPPVPSLDGRLCLVTGAASGIGRATALAAARRGARLVACDVNGALLDELATELGGALAAKRAFDIADVSSAAGLLGLPWHAPYSAAKFGLRGVSEVLRFDLRRHDIGVTLVCPGGVDTPIAESVDIAGIERGATAESKFGRRFRRHAKSADHAAECILDGIVRNRYRVYTAGDIRALHMVQR